MIIVYKNYKKTNNVLLGIESVRNFMPNVQINCILQYDSDKNEYSEDIECFAELNVNCIYVQKKYNFGGGSGNINNGFYFTEFANAVAEKFADKEKVIVFDEDNYFTTGQTLRWFEENDFDLACCYWPGPGVMFHYNKRPSFEMNASIYGLNLIKLKYHFPLPEIGEFCEFIFGHELHDRAKSDGFDIKIIPNRNFNNYYGDGKCTNLASEIFEDLINSKILDC
jgi:hypothetical protein